jgi:hypothetical protein
MNYAVLDGYNVVKNIIVANSLQVAQEVTGCTCILLTSDLSTSIGWTYSDGVFSPPEL